MVRHQAQLKCENCVYTTFWPFSLFRHLTKCHQSFRQAFNCNFADIEIFLCHVCDYESTIKVDFDNHLRKGHNWESSKLSEVNPTKWECSTCNFKTFSNFLAQDHYCQQDFMLQPKIETFEETIIKTEDVQKINLESWKDSLRRHMGYVGHLPLPDWFQCKLCSFKTVQKINLYEHVILMHRCKVDIEWFKCDQCPYKSKIKNSFKLHITRKHISANEIKWVYCDCCDYKSKCKDNLRHHFNNKHKSNDEVKWFHCGQCSYKSKYKSHLKRHNNAKHTE